MIWMEITFQAFFF